MYFYSENGLNLFRLMNPSNWAHEWIVSLELSDTQTSLLGVGLDLIMLLVVCKVVHFLTRRILIFITQRVFMKSKTTWDDRFVEQRVFRNAAYLIPALIIYESIGGIFEDYPGVADFITRLIDLYIVVILAIVANKVLRALMKYTDESPKYIGKPYKTIYQVIQVLVFFIAGIVILSMLIGEGINTVLGAMAGATALIILIFQDTINGFIANFQISMYDLIIKGDWITFDKYGVDGSVVSIDLTTVKVQNWDMTISTVPAKAFVNDSFVNWRGMTRKRMRRIKRSVFIDINSVSLCTDEMLERYSRYNLVSEYIRSRQSDIDRFNNDHGIDKSAGAEINGRHQTNIGIYRAYVQRYLEKHPAISKAEDAIIMVRQLQPTSQGMPLEIYCFSNDIVWQNYEHIQSDIFDHLYAATAYFNLRLFQSVSGNDVHYLKSREEA